MSFPTTHPALARALSTRGYTDPTAVQLAVLDPEAAGRDLLVSAQTGSGKTVAFGLALGTRLLGDSERLDAADTPLALVIAPTRELALQVSRELAWLYEATGARVVTCVGGMDARSEARQLDAGAHIVVGTPGRLRDHIERRRLDLSQLAAAVIDEADEMLDLGFREDLEFILEAMPSQRQMLLFSATLPREIEALAGRYQHDAVRIETLRRNEPHADIDYVAHRVAPQDIENAVVNVLRFHESRAALVFCTTREAVNRLSARLVERGFSAVALSGELTQHERTRALQSLRDGRSRVLVATDVAARGLDLPDLALVIHAELPHDAETLLHRSGRTGRAGRKGLCALIVPFNRRRKAEALIGAARLKVTWAPAPTPDEIRAQDQQRFVADASFASPASEDEEEAVRALQAERTADEIALALVRLHGARLPAAEDLMADTGPPRREWQPREGAGGKSRFREDRGGSHAPRPRREDTGDMVWFRINIGRERNADPRWLLPLICRAGGVTKSEIGAIRIEARDTRFQVAAAFADAFGDAVRLAGKGEGQIVRVDGNAPAPGAPSRAPQGARPSAPTARNANGEAGAEQQAQTRPSPTRQDVVARASPEAPALGPAKKRDKPRWREGAKVNNGGWAARRRDDKGKPSPRKKTSPVGYSEGGAGKGARPAAKHAKKKHHAGRPSRP